ncbi:MAG: glycosyltransferase [Methylophilaceae bacterium]|nr:glycosyltransferase [Methylophilaceae bacterium]
MTWRLTQRHSRLPRAGMSVAVWVPTYNESVEMLRRTLRACMFMDYPHTTWLLDDGNRPEMRRLAQELGCEYLSRSDNAHAKAGNLNHAMQNSHEDFIAIFDADHAPRKDFLVKTLGFFGDDKVAFVQTPQDFYNLDSFQNRTNSHNHLTWHEQTLFFRVIQRGKDFWNSAFFCGSCAVIRRQHLDEIGGFATGTVTEDIHTSLRLHKRGYRSVYIPESLAYGVAPAKIEPFLKQRIRWGIGAMNVWRKEGILFARGLTVAQRLSYLATVLAYFDGWQKAIFYIAPVIVLAFGAMPIEADTTTFLLHFIPFYLLNFLAFEEISRGYGRSLLTEQYNMARFASFAWSTLGWLRIRKHFGVTAKRQNHGERPLRFLLPQTLVLLLNVGAIPLGIYLYFRYAHLPAYGLWANVVWGLINAGLAGAVIRFALKRSQNRREEYRFPISLVGQLEIGASNKCLGTLDDISPSGFKFYGKFSEVVTGMPIRGDIFSPGGRIPFEATVRSINLAYEGDTKIGFAKSLGCEFKPMSEAAHTQLEGLLFGTDLQLRMQGYTDQEQTPLQKLHLLSGKHLSEDHGKILQSHWSAVFFRREGEAGDMVGAGLLAMEKVSDVPNTLMAYRELRAETNLQLTLFSRSHPRRLWIKCGIGERFETVSGTIYSYPVSAWGLNENERSAEDLLEPGVETFEPI